MNDKSTMALSSLAIGVSAAALLGVSEVAAAGEEEYCTLYQSCNLGYYPILSGVHYSDPVETQYLPQLLVEVEGIMAGYSGGYERYGQCEVSIPPGQENPKCGCVGYVYQVRLEFYTYNYPYLPLEYYPAEGGQSVFN